MNSMAQGKLKKTKQFSFTKLILGSDIACIAIAAVCTAIGITRLVGHLAYPVWIQAPWAMADVLLTLDGVVHGVVHGVVYIISMFLWSSGNDAELIVVPPACIAFIFLVCGAMDRFMHGSLGTLSVGLLVFSIPVPAIDIFLAWQDRKSEKVMEVDMPKINPDKKDDKPICSICQRDSLYSVCLECEREHQHEIQRVRSQNWRAKKASEPATLTIDQWLRTLEAFNYKCAYCQTGPYQCMEHYIPIGQGKKDGGTTAKNCVPACHKCNTEKSNKHPERQ